MESVVVLLKWIAQGLIVIVGTWGLLSDPYKVDPDTGARNLTRNGWTKILLLGVGFLLFAITDVNQRIQAKARSVQQTEQLGMQELTIANQERQLGYSRELLLLQHEISELTVTLEFSESVRRRFERAIQNYRSPVTQTRADESRLTYILEAARRGSAVVRYGQEGTGNLEFSINRPQGFVAERVEQYQAEWQAYVNAFQSMFGRRFEIRSDTGRVLIDLLHPEHYMTIRHLDNSMALTIRSPGVRLDEIEGQFSIVVGITEVLFVEEERPYDEEEEGEGLKITEQRPQVGPIRMQLTSMDPRVEWNQTIKLRYRPKVIHKAGDIDTTTIAHRGEWHAGPFPVQARFVGFEGLSP